MGGLGSINHWYANKLTAEDFLHLNENGYAFQGELFYQALSKAYNAYTAERRVRPLVVNEGIDYIKLMNQMLSYNPTEPIFLVIIYFGFSFLFSF